MPFTNAKFEHILPEINCMKSERRKQLTRAQVDVCLSVGEWFLGRVHKLNYNS